MYSAKIQKIKGIFKKHQLKSRVSNFRKSHTTRAHTSNIDLALMMSDPKRVMRNPAAQSFLTTFQRHGLKVQEHLGSLDDDLRSGDEALRPFREKVCHLHRSPFTIRLNICNSALRSGRSRRRKRGTSRTRND